MGVLAEGGCAGAGTVTRAFVAGAGLAGGAGGQDRQHAPGCRSACKHVIARDPSRRQLLNREMIPAATWLGLVWQTQANLIQGNAERSQWYAECVTFHGLESLSLRLAFHHPLLATDNSVRYPPKRIKKYLQALRK